jgi:phage terminase small subunit
MPVLQNAKHERFAQELAKGKTADEAYVAAGYRSSRKNASRLRTNEDILARVEQIQSKAAEKAAVTVSDIAAQLDEDRAFARQNGAAAAAVSATMGKAKILGLIVDKTAGPDGGPVQHYHRIERVIVDPHNSDT